MRLSRKTMELLAWRKFKATVKLNEAIKINLSVNKHNTSMVRYIIIIISTRKGSFIDFSNFSAFNPFALSL